MRDKKGFTLVEIIAVLIIIGIIMIIAIPAVSKYILNSSRASYASDVQAYVETIRSEYEMNDYGDYVNDNEIMIVPIEQIVLEKGDSGKSPFAAYDYSRSYVLIVPERNGFNFYANVVDVRGIGVVMKSSNELNKDAIDEEITDEDIAPWESYKNRNYPLSYNGKYYSMCEIRDIETLEKKIEESIIVLCED